MSTDVKEHRGVSAQFDNQNMKFFKTSSIAVIKKTAANVLVLYCQANFLK